MATRPDLVGCWIFRVTSPDRLEILLIRRAPGQSFAGIWQCVTGGLEGDERVVEGALREVVEETGISAADIEVLYGLDQVNVFHAERVDMLLTEAVFAAEIGSSIEPRLSHEHDARRWVTPIEAREMVIWPAYREAIARIEWLVAHPEHARWLRTGAWAVEGSSPPDSR